MNIFVLTDLHIRYEADGNPTAKRATQNIHGYTRCFWKASERLDRFVKATAQHQPDLVLGLGDFVGECHTANWYTFLHGTDGKEGWNDIQSVKELTIGNHELNDGSYADVVAAIGYEQRPVVAGSRFNRSFPVIADSMAARILMVDTNIGAEGHLSTDTGFLQPDALEWLEGEMRACPEEIVILCSHHGPQHWKTSRSGQTGPTLFDPKDAEALASIVRKVAAIRPRFRVYNLFGHVHGVEKEWYTAGLSVPSRHALTTSLTGICPRHMVDFKSDSLPVVKLYQHTDTSNGNGFEVELLAI